MIWDKNIVSSSVYFQYFLFYTNTILFWNKYIYHVPVSYHRFESPTFKLLSTLQMD